ncbi:helicase HerA-like domain-containing protein [Brachybacterium endophyticum]|nr:helicase HerA-like domain-containing protein [Brachybacterium endophyticum]
MTDETVQPDETAPDLDEKATAVRDAYAFEGTRIHLGALVRHDEPDPQVPVNLALGMLNRHGLIAGATGSGKTKTLQVIAEQVAAAGTPVFVADMKGDLAGIAVPGEGSEKLTARARARGQEWTARAGTTEIFSLGGQGAGIPIRTTVSDFGPVLMAKTLGLNGTQESSLSLIFHYADTKGLGLLDLKDLRALIQFLTDDEEGKKELKGIGGVSAATAGVILRELTEFENSGADVFFGEPAFDTKDLLRTAEDGTGIVSCLELPDVATRPTLFSTFMMWLLADLYQDLPEVGDADKPKLVFFFDEAHLLFKDASKAFLERVVQTVRLIRSKGVGIFFITQTPKDVPGDVLAQLGNRVQHSLRAYTPEDAKALKATASTFPRSDDDLVEVIPALGTGEAVVTVMSEDGAPTPVAVTAVRAPESSMNPAPAEALEKIVGSSSLSAYAEVVDRESAYEILGRRDEGASAGGGAGADAAGGAPAESAPAPERAGPESDASGEEKPARASKSSRKDDGILGNPAVRSFMRSAGTALGREITRSLFGTRRRR